MRILLATVCLVVATSAVAAAGLDQARKEGEVVWYTAMNVSDAETVLKPFRERYPFLEVTILRAAGPKVRGSILADAREGRFAWDVVSFNLVDIDTLAREGVLAAYVSPETKTGFPAGAVDPAGRWAAIYVRQYAIAYNTRLVKPGEAPKRWEDLLAPHWTGRLALDEGDVDWYSAMLDYRGREKGLAFMRALARQKPQRRSGHQVLLQQLAAGQFPLALLAANEIDKAREGGAPVQWVRTLDPIVNSPSQVALCIKAPHPAAARLFIDYLLSREGQRAIRARGRIAARTDLGSGPLSPQLKVHYVAPRLAADFPKHQAEFRRLLVSQR